MLFALDILCLWAMVSIKRLLQLSPPTPPYQVFTRFVRCFTRNTSSTFFCSDQNFAKKNTFSKKTDFFFQLIAGRFWFCCFVYMCFLECFFTVLPSWNLHNFHIICISLVCITFHLTSHQIMWLTRIHGHGLQAIFGFQGNYVGSWYCLHSFKLLISIRECN